MVMEGARQLVCPQVVGNIVLGEQRDGCGTEKPRISGGDKVRRVCNDALHSG